MRGDDCQQAGMWSYISPEQRVPSNHPPRPIRAMVDAILADEHFTVDGTLIEAWASLKSFKKRDMPARTPDDPRESHGGLSRRAAEQ